MHDLYIKTFNLGELQTNCYIAWDALTNDAVIIDPADSGGMLSEFILENNLQLSAILLTHGHFDHCLGLLELNLNFAVPVYLHEKDLPLIKTAQKSAQHWLKHSVDPVPTPTHSFVEGEVVTFGEVSLTVLETPGHTPGSVCFISKPEVRVFIDGLQIYSETKIVLTGDTLFKDTFPRTDFRYSSVLQLHESWEKLKNVGAETTILPGHGDLTRLGATAVFVK